MCSAYRKSNDVPRESDTVSHSVYEDPAEFLLKAA